MSVGRSLFNKGLQVPVSFRKTSSFVRFVFYMGTHAFTAERTGRRERKTLASKAHGRLPVLALSEPLSYTHGTVDTSLPT
jgi:hypothetical protein